jgi:hypothetical protein
MKINLESNFILLGSEDVQSMDFTGEEITLKELLDTIAGRWAINPPEFLDRDGEEQAIDVEIEANGRSLCFCPGGVNTVLRDGDRVSIRLMPTGGG